MLYNNRSDLHVESLYAIAYINT